MKHNVIGIDLAKRIFQVCLLDGRGRLRMNKAVKCSQLLDVLRRQPPSRVFMEACGGSHYWARQIEGIGHEVRLVAPQFVKPLRLGHKTDANDAQAIAEAGCRPTMKYVPVKTIQQQDLQSLHRVRERLIKQRTQLINQLHGLLQEYGIVAGRGQKALLYDLAQALEQADNELSATLRELLEELRGELHDLNQRIQQQDRTLQQLARVIEPCHRLQGMRGIGPINATQLYSCPGEWAIL